MSLLLMRLLKFGGVIFIVTFYSSCSHHFYTPPESHILMVSDKDDLKLSAGAGVSVLDETSFNIQTAYSPIKHLGISANYFQLGRSTSTANNDFEESVNNYNLEGALGTYFTKTYTNTMLAEDGLEETRTNTLVFDLYGGYGRNRTTNTYSQGGSSRFNAQQFFLQGGVHFQGDFLGLSYTLRGVQLDFIDGEVFGQVSDSHLSDIEDLNNDPFTFLESSVRIRAGGPKFKCFITRNWMSPPFGDKALEYSSSSWHLGCIVELSTIFDKKIKPKSK